MSRMDGKKTHTHTEIFLRNTQSADVRITSFRTFNRIMYRLRKTTEVCISDFYFVVRITSFRMFNRMMYPLRINCYLVVFNIELEREAHIN